MSDTISNDSVAQDQLRAFIERIERLEEEKKAIADDIKEVYAEAKGNGFSTAVMREIVKLRRKDHTERMEFEAILDLYMAALGMQAAPRDDDDFDPSPRDGPQPEHRVQPFEMRGVSEITESRPADAPVATEADGPSGDNARQQSEPLPPDPAAQENLGANFIPFVGAIGCSSSGRTEPSADGQSNPDAPTPLPMGQGQRAAEPVTREQSPAEAKTSDQEPLSNGSGEVQDECAIHLPTNSHTTEEQGLAGPACIRDAGAANTKPAPILDTILSLRPHCQDPDTCASAGGKSHCFQCRKAAWLNGVEAA